MIGIADVAPAGQLIAFLAVLATALAVGLSDDRAVAAVGPADAARCQHQIDRAERVLDAVGVMLDAARVEQEARSRRAPPSPRPARWTAPARRSRRRSGRASTARQYSATASKPVVCAAMKS